MTFQSFSGLKWDRLQRAFRIFLGRFQGPRCSNSENLAKPLSSPEDEESVASFTAHASASNTSEHAKHTEAALHELAAGARWDPARGQGHVLGSNGPFSSKDARRFQGTISRSAKACLDAHGS